MGKYEIILCDPPWQYRDKCNAGKRGAAHKYPVLSLVDIKALDVPSIAADDCALFLWSTMPMLPDALEVMDAWGFQFKTVAFVWAKQTKKQKWHWGMGNWTRANGEIVLLGTRGRPSRASAAVHSLVVERIRKHSQKPDVVRDRIVQLMGDLPRIELFAREKMPGWDVWGNEVENDVEIGAAP